MLAKVNFGGVTCTKVKDEHLGGPLANVQAKSWLWYSLENFKGFESLMRCLGF
jgi:hypothetical protein